MKDETEIIKKGLGGGGGRERKEHAQRDDLGIPSNVDVVQLRLAVVALGAYLRMRDHQQRIPLRVPEQSHAVVLSIKY